MDCRVLIAVEKDIVNMENEINKIRTGIKKRQDAMKKFIALHEKHKKEKEMITKDIEEARTIWTETIKQIPKLIF